MRNWTAIKLLFYTMFMALFAIELNARECQDKYDMIFANMIRNKVLVKVTIRLPGDKQKEECTGRLLRINNDILVMSNISGEEISFPLQYVTKVKLVKKKRFGSHSILVGVGTGLLLTFIVSLISLSQS